ncbi:uncharacterized protein LOC118425027 [Branchiostoma floridae]|uniref:Uncharacterized protein LOC118425027 n=1 Tax=Branchiostoma floridae TaxID=7739 RepID=A0A9J7N4G4_BRAFL|nr:uncharacterized protein LOC118425027 [Branchiostoma floridae]
MDKLLLVTAILSVAAVSLPRVESSLCRGDVPAPSCSCQDGVVEGNGRCTLCSCTADGQPRDCLVVRLLRDPSWVVDSAGNGDAARALDGDTRTYWNPRFLGQNYNNWYIVLDLTAPFTITRVDVTNVGDTAHDATAFTLQKSQLGSPYNWEDVVTVTTVQAGTNRRQEFGGFQGTARYWRFRITRTYSGWQPWLKELDLHGDDLTAPCETVHAANCLATSPGYGPPGNQPCNVTLDIHEGIRSIDNPLQVHQCGNIIINTLVSFQCDHAYKVSFGVSISYE